MRKMRHEYHEGPKAGESLVNLARAVTQALRPSAGDGPLNCRADRPTLRNSRDRSFFLGQFSRFWCITLETPSHK